MATATNLCTMTNKIDFYINESPTSYHALAELILNLEKNGIYIHTDDANQANEISKVFWAHPKDRFIAHSLATHLPQSVIELGYKDIPKERSFIINASSNQLARVHIEWVSYQKDKARQRYQYWKKAGFTLETHIK